LSPAHAPGAAAAAPEPAAPMGRQPPPPPAAAATPAAALCDDDDDDEQFLRDVDDIMAKAHELLPHVRWPQLSFHAVMSCLRRAHASILLFDVSSSTDQPFHVEASTYIQHLCCMAMPVCTVMPLACAACYPYRSC
jgi:hypothetical protein